MAGILWALSRADQCVPASVLLNPPTWTCSPKLYLTSDAYAEKKKKSMLVTWRKVKKEGTPPGASFPTARLAEVVQGSALFILGGRKQGNLPLKPHSPLNQGEPHTSSAAQDTAHSPRLPTLSSSAASWMSSSWFSQEAYVSAMHVHPSPVKLIAHSSDSCHKAARAH